jgi:LEA14-like dessication related protein
MNTFLLLAGGVAAWYLLGKQTAAGKLEYKVKNVDISKGKIYLVIEIINPTYKDLTVDSINLKIISEGLNLGRIDYFEKSTISGRAKTYLRLPATLNIGFDLGTWIAKVIKGQINTIEVTGTALSMGFETDLSETLNLKQ